ncbi:hypothetical protein H0H92_004094 [Tricholoma furcatifolium]|nr:hypothetical protein H0H92_004094 [Tricholoma furcatifolium]
MADMDVDPPTENTKREGKEKEGKARFEVKKVCLKRILLEAIASTVKPIKYHRPTKSVTQLGESVT